MREFALRNKIEDAKGEYLEKYGALDWHWKDEGLIWTLQDYHGSKGSVLDFTEDDWMVCRDNGLMLNEVLKLCDEMEFSPDVDSLEQFFSGFPCDIPKEDAIAAVEDFYTWRREQLPKVQAIYGEEV